jgi:hypothetical protein
VGDADVDQVAHARGAGGLDRGADRGKVYRLELGCLRRAGTSGADEVDQGVGRPDRSDEGLGAECIAHDRESSIRQAAFGARSHECAHDVSAGEEPRDEQPAEVTGRSGDEDIA